MLGSADIDLRPRRIRGRSREPLPGLGSLHFSCSQSGKKPKLALACGLCNPVPMKNKNKRELEKRWKTEAAKKRKSEKKKGTRQEEVNQPAAQIVREAPEH